MVVPARDLGMPVWVRGQRWLEGEEGNLTFNVGCVEFKGPGLLTCAIHMLLGECKLAELEEKTG